MSVIGKWSKVVVAVLETPFYYLSTLMRPICQFQRFSDLIAHL